MTYRGTPCLFPFKYEGKTYRGCTKAGGMKRFWCATGVGSSMYYRSPALNDKLLLHTRCIAGVIAVVAVPGETQPTPPAPGTLPGSVRRVSARLAGKGRGRAASST